jgi:hypothetical protein
MPRSAALIKYNASQRKRLRTRWSSRDEDSRCACRLVLVSVRIKAEVSYPGPGQKAARRKSSSFHAQNTKTSCLLFVNFGSAIVRRGKGVGDGRERRAAIGQPLAAAEDSQASLRPARHFDPHKPKLFVLRHSSILVVDRQQLTVSATPASDRSTAFDRMRQQWSMSTTMMARVQRGSNARSLLRATELLSG